MKSKKILLSLILIFGITLTSNAQFWKKLKEKAKQKIEQEAERRTERRVNNKIDKTFDKAEEKLDEAGKKKHKKETSDSSENQKSIKQEQTQEASNGMSEMLNGMLNQKEVKTESSYTFPVTATLQVTNYTDNGTHKMVMKQSYGNKAIMSEMQEPKNIMITDFNNEAAIMIDPEAKTARTMSMAWMKKMMQKGVTENEKSDTAKMKKTGKTNTILGYTCYQYFITDEDIKIEVWFAPDVKFDYNDYLSGMNKMFGNKKSNAVSLLNKGKGYVMDMIIFEKGKRTTEMFVTDISEKPITINLNEYTIQKMF